jgi:hypothetical protein
VSLDPRLHALIDRQQASGFRGLAGSEAHATIKISGQLLNEAVAAFAASTSAISELSIHPHNGNRFDVRLGLAKPAFLPGMTMALAIERQPQLPGDPVLVLRLSGGASVLRLAAPAIANFNILPAGVRLEGDRVLVDLRTLLQRRGQAQLLDHAQEVEIVTVEGGLVVFIHLQVKP